MKWMAAAALMLAPVLASAQTTCPDFKNPELQWNQRKGADYTLCYVELPSHLGSGSGFGVYLGHRSFKPNKKARAEKGTVGTQAVQWYTKATVGNARPHSREAMIVLPGSKAKKKVKVYAWIDAATPEQLQEGLAVARELSVN